MKSTVYQAHIVEVLGDFTLIVAAEALNRALHFSPESPEKLGRLYQLADPLGLLLRAIDVTLLQAFHHIAKKLVGIFLPA